MLFKNAFIYRFTKPVPWTPSELQTSLENHAFSPCSANDSYRLGWIPPSPAHGADLTYTQGRYVLITLNKEEKILPASVINDEVNKRAESVEQKEQRKLRKKEKQELKEQAIALLLPQAFTRSKQTSAYLDVENGWLVVDTSSANKADEFTATLRQAIGTLPVRFLSLKEAPGQQFSEWVKKDQYPTPFSSGDQCDLHADDGSDKVIRCKGTESLTDAIASHIESGMQVTQIALSWDEKISFLLSDDVILKRIKYMDTFYDKAADEGSNPAAQFDADFSLLTLEFGKLLSDIIRVLGGEDKSELVG